MECNKDEAVRAKQVAESRMQKGEYVEALKFAIKAKQLYPDVENIAQILAVCEVHNAALNKLYRAEMDWYGILQTEKLSEEAVIRKQYRKLALLLHPDKNKFAGAEAAFKLIGEANGVLNDQTKRILHDMKVRAHLQEMKVKGNLKAVVPTTSSHHSNGNVFAANQVPNATKHRKNVSSNVPCDPNLKLQTFWTACNHCNTRFQFYIYVKNRALVCQNCKKSFIAFGISQQTTSSYVPFGAPKAVPTQVPPNPGSTSKDEKPLGGGSEDTFVRSTPRMKTCDTGVGKDHKDEKSKNAYVPVSKPKESQASKNVGSKRVRQPEPDSKERFNTRNNDENQDPSRLNVRRSSRQKQHVSYVENHEDESYDVTYKKPRKTESFNNDEVEEKNVSEETILRNTSKDEPSHVQGDKVSESDHDPRRFKEQNGSPLNSDIPSSPEIIYCPDTDFNDFDKDKAKDSFAANQLWAIYDTTDAMPRFYALVKKVASPFNLHITWLEANPYEDDEKDWYNADLPIACGKFKLANTQKTTDLGMFSHQIQCIKGNDKKSFIVYPKKGETWAIYSNWDINWSSNPENFLKREIAYVEIESDFSKNVGIEVSLLGKVKGFTSLFEKTGKNGEKTFCILPKELYRFSHQIPSYKMSGDEREGVPRGCFELDPAALPVNILEADEE
ncbi:unnamed protein product [Lathyrus oleraceus]